VGVEVGFIRVVSISSIQEDEAEDKAEMRYYIRVRRRKKVWVKESLGDPTVIIIIRGG
jgi:hypothetical protein